MVLDHEWGAVEVGTDFSGSALHGRQIFVHQRQIFCWDLV